MASLQERIQINRMPLDKWSVREQLCLASAVACSGDQNWMTVSRTLKIVCGNTKDALQSRPVDWFSQKNCAVQYGHLLEDVETPKRKKRTSESSVPSSPPAVDPPTEAILRRLTEDRMQEIKLELRREQEVRFQVKFQQICNICPKFTFINEGIFPIKFQQTCNFCYSRELLANVSLHM